MPDWFRQLGGVFPTDTSTFLFADIEGSTELAQRLGPTEEPGLSTS
ncbi:MAG: hypothetical protein ACE5F5_06720 [Acidimicrobiia bacterium]